MPTVLLQLPGGHGVVRRHDGEIVITLRVTTAIGGHHRDELRQARHALEGWVCEDRNRRSIDGLSDAAARLWFAARRRDRCAAAIGVTRTEQLITIDGGPEPCITLSTPTGRWVAVRRQEGLTVTIAARHLDLPALALEPIPDPGVRLLGREPSETPDRPD